ncbi:MAG TPA: F0F1 ATP synthase subunit B [Thermoanaerobaculia bacterium]|nr:F0F1 ATP synthase subunit B [Thermoanaerobaculia bacterium]
MRSILLALFLVLAIVPRGNAEVSGTDHSAQGSEKVAPEGAQASEAHGEGEHAPETFLGIPTWILKLANMLLFIGVLVYLLKGPIGSAFRARGEQIRAQLEEAKARRTKSDQLATDIQSRLSGIEKEVQSVLTRAHDEGERQKREIIESARNEAEKILNTAKNEVEARIKQARKELTEYAGTLAADRARQILETSLTEEDRRRLFDESVRSVGESRS